MDYINNIYDYKTMEVRACSGQKTHRAIICQGLAKINHSVTIDAIADHHSTLELHILTDIYGEDYMTNTNLSLLAQKCTPIYP